MKDVFAVLRQTVEKHRQKGFRESSWQCPFRAEEQCKQYGAGPSSCKNCLYDKILEIIAEAEAEVNRLPEDDWMT